MKILFTDCRLPLGEGHTFCVQDGVFARPLPPYGKTIRLDGAFVLPAFPDAHSHLLAYALSRLQADGARCRTAEDFLSAANAFLAAHGERAKGVVTVRNAETLPPQRAIGVPFPLHIQMRSGHAGVFNEAACARLGLPFGEGALEESAYLAALARVPMPPYEAIVPAFRGAQEDYLAHGMTVAQEGILTREMFPVYEMLLEEDALFLDTIAYPAPADYDEARARFSGQTRLKIGGVKIFLDGSPQQRTAFLREPYTGGGRGMSEMDVEQVRHACRFALSRNAQILAHCNGDGAAQIFLEALAAFPPQAQERLRPVLIHAQILGEDQLDAIAHLGATPSFFPAHILYWGDLHLKNLGRSRAERISPARSALRRKIAFTLHQDAPVCPPDPLEAARCAVLRETRAGEVFAAQAIGVTDALRALTEHAARQYGFSDMGRIEEGFRADFVVLNGDPFHDIRGTHVRETWLRGRCVFRREGRR